MIGHLFCSFSNLHFITCKFGADGFPLWNQIMIKLSAILMDIKGVCGSNELEEYDTPVKILTRVSPIHLDKFSMLKTPYVRSF
jgi:hypothetical protein